MINDISGFFSGGNPNVKRGPGDMGSFLKGTVTENNNQEFPGMVKVEFISWESGKNICEWIPVLHPYAGGAYGSYVMPEIGDSVVVGFMGASHTNAFVIGCLYPTDSEFLKQSFQEKNFNKNFKTKGNFDLAISDEEEKQSMIFTTPKETKVEVMEEAQTLTIHDKEDKDKLFLDIVNGALDLTIEKKITITCGKCTITIDGEGGAINVTADKIEVAANQTAKIAAQQELALEGATFKADGKQQVAISGGTMTEIKGQMIKLN